MTDYDSYRAEARSWLQSVAGEFGRDARRGLTEEQDLALGRHYLAKRYEAGYGGIHLPVEFGGQGLSHVEKVIFETEEMGFGMPIGYFSISLGMPVPIIARFVEDWAWVKERVVKALRGEEIWCQLFSEPAAGSDLAGLRARAEPDGDGWKINGQKLWTSWAQYADYGITVLRTDATVPKHKGLTYFWIDMHAQGVEVRPIKLADGGHDVNEVFLDDVHLTDSQRMSPVGGGFGVAMATLMIERYAATDSNGFGPGLDNLVELARGLEVNGRPALQDGRVRSAIARNHAMRAGLDSITTRAMLSMQAGQEPGPEGALNKLFSVRSRQKLSELAIDLQGARGVTYDVEGLHTDDWTASWLAAPTGRIAGGADEMLLNTIAEKILNLPQDHRPDKGISFSQIVA